MIIILNSKPLKADAKMLDGLTPGIIDRDGVFETTRVLGGRIFAWRAHIKRFKKGLRSLKMKMPCSEKCLLEFSRRVIRENNIEDGSLRISAWKDGEVRFAVIVRRNTSAGSIAKKGFKAAVAKPVYRSSRGPRVKSLKYSFFRKAQ
jgi:4-amino-4-deoxychorismate lyase